MQTFTHTRAALAIFDASAPERRAAWDRVESEADINAAEQADRDALTALQTAFHQDTADTNSRDHCARADAGFIRRVANRHTWRTVNPGTAYAPQWAVEDANGHAVATVPTGAGSPMWAAGDALRRAVLLRAAPELLDATRALLPHCHDGRLRRQVQTLLDSLKA
jgi:hypothetical protein